MVEKLYSHAQKDGLLVDNIEQEQPNSNKQKHPIHRHPREIFAISGLLPGGRRFTRPLTVVIEYDDEEVVVSEPRYYMHASGPTKEEALTAFRRIFSNYLDLLAKREKTLGPPLRDQLSYLRDVITTE